MSFRQETGAQSQAVALSSEALTTTLRAWAACRASSSISFSRCKAETLSVSSRICSSVCLCRSCHTQAQDVICRSMHCT